ncbi:hypothetical protein [Synechococcus sp. PCC 7336]|uniref:hypothetical protein n=1 Tax=Synechococcus sp. PCC 7336 TaxID=195250 RepID=UPI00056FAD83|nr:hypothetical protein [Synechococcus sp. PCC 7336]
MSSSGPYRSRLFRHAVRQYRRTISGGKRTWRHFQAAVWRETQVLLLPFYKLFRAVEQSDRQFSPAQSQSRLTSAASSGETASEAIEQLVQVAQTIPFIADSASEVLTAPQLATRPKRPRSSHTPSLASRIEYLESNSPLARSQPLQIQAIASQIDSRALVLVTPRNDVLNCLSGDRQALLAQRIENALAQLQAPPISSIAIAPPAPTWRQTLARLSRPLRQRLSLPNAAEQPLPSLPQLWKKLSVPQSVNPLAIARQTLQSLRLQPAESDPGQPLLTGERVRQNLPQPLQPNPASSSPELETLPTRYPVSAATRFASFVPSASTSNALLNPAGDRPLLPPGPEPAPLPLLNPPTVGFLRPAVKRALERRSPATASRLTPNPEQSASRRSPKSAARSPSRKTSPISKQRRASSASYSPTYIEVEATPLGNERSPLQEGLSWLDRGVFVAEETALKGWQWWCDFIQEPEQPKPANFAAAAADSRDYVRAWTRKLQAIGSASAQLAIAILQELMPVLWQSALLLVRWSKELTRKLLQWLWIEGLPLLLKRGGASARWSATNGWKLLQQLGKAFW